MKDGNIRCRVCGDSSVHVFDGEVIGKPIAYFDCGNCGYLQTEFPTWLEQAYKSPINISDTGIIARNMDNARRVAAVCFLLKRRRPTIIDFAGGYGLLVRMLRDLGIEAKWADPFCENLFARGFEYTEGSADFVTAFEAFEHFVEPSDELNRMLSIAPTVMFSTSLLPEPTPKPSDWWYYGSEHGQHIGFFRRSTLEYLAKRHSGFAYSDGSQFHLISKVPIKLRTDRIPLTMRTLRIWRRFLGPSLTWSDHELVSKR